MRWSFFILVEGKADIVFLRDYLIYLIPSLKESCNKTPPKTKILEDESYFIEIIYTGSYNAIENLKPTINERIDQNYEILVIQDADTEAIEHGGLQKRNAYLQNIFKKINDKVEFKCFLFPDNKTDGDIESLLLKIVNMDKFNRFNSCRNKYLECIRQDLKQNIYNEFLDKKDIIYDYFRIYCGKKNAKEENRKFNKACWDFESTSLESFKFFLKENLNLSEIE